MAQEITNQFLSGLLAGPSSLQAAERAQAMELARLSPIQQSSFAGIQAGQEVSRGVRGMLGVQTPEEQRMNTRSQARQQAASQAGGDRLKFLEAYATALDTAGDAEGAFQARSILDQERRVAAESASKVFQQQASGTASLATAMREKEPKEPTKVGVSEEGQNVFLKGGRQFTIDASGNYIPFSGKIREGAGTNVTLSVPQEADLIRQGQAATKEIGTRTSAINRSLDLNAQNSPFAGAAFKQEVASVFGDAQKAATEIQALANTGALDTRIANSVVSFLEGKTTQTTKQDRDAVLKILLERNRDEYERKIRPFRAAVTNTQQAMRLFPSFEEAFGISKGITKQGRPIPAGQESKYTEGSKWERGGKKYVVRGGQLIEE
jgi:hypothetical protein